MYRTPVAAWNSGDVAGSGGGPSGLFGRRSCEFGRRSWEFGQHSSGEFGRPSSGAFGRPSGDVGSPSEQTRERVIISHIIFVLFCWFAYLLHIGKVCSRQAGGKYTVRS